MFYSLSEFNFLGAKLISHKHKCIFIHIPKCAGTSLETALGHFEGHQGREGQDHRSVRMIQKPFPPFKSLSSRENIKDTVRRFREYTRTPTNPNTGEQVTAQQYNEYFKFTVVRHPVDRAYSWYKNVMRDPIQQVNYGVPANIDFDSFIRKFAGTGFLRAQTYWLCDYSGRVDMDLIIQFRDLAEGFKTVCEQLGIHELELPHKISGETDANEKEIESKTLAFIKRFYAEDYRIFAYN